MKTNALILAAGLLVSPPAFAQLLFTQTGESSFFSETPMENISAINKTASAVLNTTNAELAVRINLIDFRFSNKLMEEHFNENYVESDKYPTASFRGKIQEAINFTKEGTYDVTAKGIFDLHGVKQERVLKSRLVVTKDQLAVWCNFDVRLADYKIDIPSLVFTKIAETIAVKNHFVLTAKK